MAWNRKNLLVRAVAVLLIGAGATQALAQGQGRGRGPGGFGGFGGGGAGFLVQIAQVQKELGVTDEQKQSLTKIGEESREARRGLGGPGGQNLSDEEQKARREKMDAITADTRKKIDGVLDEKQRTRLKEITLQVQGNSALTDDKELAAALGITEEQKTKLTELRKEMRDKMQENFRAARESNDFAGLQEKNQTLTKDNGEKVASVLTADQKEKFEKMKGAKFELDFSAFRGPGGGQGRRRGGNNNNNN